MYDWWVLQLAKLSVSRKLMVGFGVLLALLLLVVISSNRTLTHQTALSEQLAEVASLMEQTQQAEQGRLAFEAGSDPRQAEQVRQTLAGMLQRLQALRDSELDPAALAHQAEAIEAYRKAFDDLAAADQQRSAARGVLVGTAQQALDSFARLEELMDASLAQQAGDPQALQRSRAVVDLHQQLLMVRYQVRGYVFERSDKAEQAAFAAFDALRQAATTLRGQLPGEADAALEQAMGSLQGYRGGIEQFRAGVIRTRQAQQAMQSSTQDMARAGRTLTEAGRQLRESTASRDRASLWLIAALALAFGCVAGWAINRQIVRPLDEALAQAEAIAAGDLGKRPQNPLTLQRRDELGQLQRVMQRMGDSLRELVGRIGDGVSQLASSAEELSAVTEQTRAGVNSQKVETDQVATAMHEMAATVQDVARNAELASQAARQADEEARQGDAVVDQAVTRIERLASEMDVSSEAMARLKNESEQIGSVLDVIKSVAEQTNLLALNAAIEAARAGDAGRGFAVGRRRGPRPGPAHPAVHRRDRGPDPASPAGRRRSRRTPGEQSLADRQHGGTGAPRGRRAGQHHPHRLRHPEHEPADRHCRGATEHGGRGDQPQRPQRTRRRRAVGRRQRADRRLQRRAGAPGHAVAGTGGTLPPVTSREDPPCIGSPSRPSKADRRGTFA